MIYMIDAWLECAHPKLRILDKDTGVECLVLDEEMLTLCIEQGILDMESLCSTNQDLIQEFTKELLEFDAIM